MSRSDNQDLRSRYHISDVSLSLTRNFYEWEIRLRGYDVWPYPVSPEPPFIPLYEQPLELSPVEDDGRKETFFSRIASVFTGGTAAVASEDVVATSQAVQVIDDDSWIPDLSIPVGELCAFQVQLPETASYAPTHCAQFFRALGALKNPISFEIIGTQTYIVLQFVCRDGDHATVGSQLHAFSRMLSSLKVRMFSWPLRQL